jgi:pantoate--beta-alanine ligase
MHVCTDLNEWRAIRAALPPALSIGFVPTMGNLHQGHGSLLHKSRHDNEISIASIFVNPTQFNQEADFTHYPRTLDADLERLMQAGVDYCLLPENSAIYADEYRYQISEQHNADIMEGKKRPGHFTGVLTVVMKLFNLIQPTRAYFGEKDYQQLQLIQGMVTAFFMNIDIIACPTIREISGLACSSRNSRLSVTGRNTADQFARIFQDKSQTRNTIIKTLHDLHIDIDYIEEHEGRRFAAVTIDGVRLIDNITIKPVN